MTRKQSGGIRDTTPLAWGRTPTGRLVHLVEATAFEEGRIGHGRPLCDNQRKTFHFVSSADIGAFGQCPICLIRLAKRQERLALAAMR